MIIQYAKYHDNGKHQKLYEQLAGNKSSAKT